VQWPQGNSRIPNLHPMPLVGTSAALMARDLKAGSSGTAQAPWKLSNQEQSAHTPYVLIAFL
jgi:hypothetical protein